MRTISRVFEVTSTSVVQKVATREEITFYTIYPKDKRIEVSVEFSDDKGENLKKEYFTFKDDKFIENATEEDVWSLIDFERAD